MQTMQCLQKLSFCLDQLQVVSTFSPSDLDPAALASVVPPASDSPLELQLPLPPHFSGDPKACRGFIIPRWRI